MACDGEPCALYEINTKAETAVTGSIACFQTQGGKRFVPIMVFEEGEHSHCRNSAGKVCVRQKISVMLWRIKRKTHSADKHHCNARRRATVQPYACPVRNVKMPDIITCHNEVKEAAAHKIKVRQPTASAKIFANRRNPT